MCDPYRWLEDPDSEETKEFVKNQNNLTRPYLDECIYKDQIKSTLTELWNYPKCSHPARLEELKELDGFLHDAEQVVRYT